MSRTEDLSNLATAAEVARRLHLQSGDIVRFWHRHHPDFPNPWVRFADGEPLWAVTEVERWAESRGWRG